MIGATIQIVSSDSTIWLMWAQTLYVPKWGMLSGTVIGNSRFTIMNVRVKEKKTKEYSRANYIWHRLLTEYGTCQVFGAWIKTLPFMYSQPFSLIYDKYTNCTKKQGLGLLSMP